jgi:hypothetical protein
MLLSRPADALELSSEFHIADRDSYPFSAVRPPFHSLQAGTNEVHAKEEF